MAYNQIPRMHLATLKNVDFSEKNVLVRVDFNVTLENGNIKEKFKMETCKETIEYIRKFQGTRVALISHMGRPEGKVNADFSLRQIVDDIQRVLGYSVIFVESCVGDSVQKSMSAADSGSVLLLENVRFHPGEEENSEKFSSDLANPFDVYVNDAFSVCHRNQASVTGITRYIPSYAGLGLEKEIQHLERIKNNPERPAVAIIGGAKIQTKLPMIHMFEKKYDFVLVGGKIANEAIDEEKTFSSNVLLPIDFVGDRMDIGPKTVALFKEKIREAKTVIWNGPMGKFEDPAYSSGTFLIARSIMDSEAFSLVGGGESVEVLEENNWISKFSFVSTGGGALLEFLSGSPMPGIDVLKGK